MPLAPAPGTLQGRSLSAGPRGLIEWTHELAPCASRGGRGCASSLNFAYVRLRVGALRGVEGGSSLLLAVEDPAEDDEVARVQARELGRVEDADVRQAGVHRLS